MVLSEVNKELFSMRTTLLLFLLGGSLVLVLTQGILHIQALDLGLKQYAFNCNSWGLEGGECNDPLDSKYQALKGNGQIYEKFISLLGIQSIFIAVAFFVAVISLFLTALLSILLDWLENERGAGRLSSLFQNVLDTIPYTVWLLILLSVWGPVTQLGEDYNFPRTGVIAGQFVVYLGVSLLLLPLFLVLLRRKIRLARRDHFFDAMAMDGFSAFQRYRKVIRHKLMATMAKLVMFATAFIIMFDATLITLVGGGDNLPPNTVVLNSDFPDQFFVSPFAQLAVLEKNKDRGIVDLEAQLSRWAGKTCRQTYNHWSAWRCFEVVRWFRDMALMYSVASRKHDADKLLPREKLVLMQRYPGLRLSTNWWQGDLTGSGNENCQKIALCREIGASKNVPPLLVKSAQRNGMISVYFFYILSVIMLLFGSVTIHEISDFMGAQDE